MLVLSAKNLHKQFWLRGQKLTVLQDVSLEIASGEVLAFLGANGAGKTTTIKTIAGLIVPDRGEVRIMGRDPQRQAAAIGALGAVLEGNRNVYWQMTVEENLEYFGILRGLSRKVAVSRSLYLIDSFDLSRKRKTTVRELSRGMQQKVAIAVALMHDPQLLLLDEPTLGLDVEATENVKVLVRELAAEGKAILLTTHQLDIAQQLSDRVAIIDKGQIIAEQPTGELIKAFLQEFYAIKLEAELDPERASKIARLGASVTGNLIQARDSDCIYQVLQIIQPLPFIKVERSQASLTDIFLQLIRGN